MWYFDRVVSHFFKIIIAVGTKLPLISSLITLPTLSTAFSELPSTYLPRTSDLRISSFLLRYRLILRASINIFSRRESHQAVWQKSDIFFLCELEPITFEIKKQDSEILAAKWMPIEEYVNQTWNQNKELFRFMANICLKRSQETKYVGFSKVLTTTSSGKESYLYCNTDHANLLNATRGLASTSTPASTSC